jgi:hypothetical protein
MLISRWCWFFHIQARRIARGRHALDITLFINEVSDVSAGSWNGPIRDTNPQNGNKTGREEQEEWRVEKRRKTEKNGEKRPQRECRSP